MRAEVEQSAPKQVGVSRDQGHEKPLCYCEQKEEAQLYPGSVLELKSLFPHGWAHPTVTLPLNSSNKVAFVFFRVKDEGFGCLRLNSLQEYKM